MILTAKILVFSAGRKSLSYHYWCHAQYENSRALIRTTDKGRWTPGQAFENPPGQATAQHLVSGSLIGAICGTLMHLLISCMLSLYSHKTTVRSISTWSALSRCFSLSDPEVVESRTRGDRYE